MSLIQLNILFYNAIPMFSEKSTGGAKCVAVLLLGKFPLQTIIYLTYNLFLAASAKLSK